MFFPLNFTLHSFKKYLSKWSTYFFPNWIQLETFCEDISDCFLQLFILLCYF